MSISHITITSDSKLICLSNGNQITIYSTFGSLLFSHSFFPLKLIFPFSSLILLVPSGDRAGLSPRSLILLNSITKEILYMKTFLNTIQKILCTKYFLIVKLNKEILLLNFHTFFIIKKFECDDSALISFYVPHNNDKKNENIEKIIEKNQNLNENNIKFNEINSNLYSNDDKLNDENQKKYFFVYINNNILTIYSCFEQKIIHQINLLTNFISFSPLYSSNSSFFSSSSSPKSLIVNDLKIHSATNLLCILFNNMDLYFYILPSVNLKYSCHFSSPISSFDFCPLGKFVFVYFSSGLISFIHLPLNSEGPISLSSSLTDDYLMSNTELLSNNNENKIKNDINLKNKGICDESCKDKEIDAEISSECEIDLEEIDIKDKEILNIKEEQDESLIENDNDFFIVDKESLKDYSPSSLPPISASSLSQSISAITALSSPLVHESLQALNSFYYSTKSFLKGKGLYKEILTPFFTISLGIKDENLQLKFLYENDILYLIALTENGIYRRFKLEILQEYITNFGPIPLTSQTFSTNLLNSDSDQVNSYIHLSQRNDLLYLVEEEKILS